MSTTTPRYRRGRMRAQLSENLATAQEVIAQELAAAQQVVSQLLQGETPAAARARQRRRRLLIATAGVVALAGGAVAFSIVRRSTQPEPSPLPPSVEVTPKP